MEALTTLFSQYSTESIILFIMAIAIAIKAVSELWEYFYNKLRKYFNYQTKKEQTYSDLMESISNLETSLSTLRQKEIVSIYEKVDLSVKRNEEVKAQVSLITERLQETTRGHIIDKHHYFCYELRYIDDLSLQSLEREYLYYKASGGDTYVDGLMEDMRELPRLTSYGIKKLGKEEAHAAGIEGIDN